MDVTIDVDNFPEFSLAVGEHLDKAAVAEDIGVVEDKIFTMNMELDALRKHGLLVDLTIAGSGMFTQSASFAEFTQRRMTSRQFATLKGHSS